MGINKKWFLALGVALAIGFVGCNKDDDKEATPEEAMNVLLNNGNDRTSRKLYGAVKSMTRTEYTSVTYTNNTISKGNVGSQIVTEFDNAGFFAKESITNNMPTACKWAKDKYGSDVIVVTARAMKVVSTDTYQHDSQHRETERLSEYTNYDIMFGGITIRIEYLLRDTIYSGPVNTNNTTFTSTAVPFKIKTVTTYDDTNKKATAITSEFDTKSNNWVEAYKVVSDLDQNGKIDENSSESFYAKESASAEKFDSQYDRKDVVQYDSQHNKTLEYAISRGDTKTSIVFDYREYSYIYY